MKYFLNILLFPFLCSGWNIAVAQTYHPFPDTNAQWSEYDSYCFDYFPGSACQSDGYLFYLSVDTVVDGKSYVLIGFNKTWQQNFQFGGNIYSSENFNYQVPGIIIGALRADSTKKVWFRKLNDSISFGWGASGYFPLNSDVLLYDFDVQVGDSLTWKPFNSKVMQMDSVQLSNGEYRKSILLASDGIYEPENWVEGVGSCFGLFGSYANPPFEAVYYLNCFRQNDSLLVGTNSYGCDHAYVGITDPVKNIVPIVYPNPTSDFLTFDLNKFNWLKAVIIIYDSQGKQILKYSGIHFPIFKIPISNIGVDGLYFYAVCSNDMDITTGKFLIER